MGDHSDIDHTGLTGVGGGYTPGGTDVAVADGGTGASSASAARTNLGLVIGTDVAAFGANPLLTEAAAPSTPASGKVIVYAKTDGRIYSKDDAGVEYGPFDAAGGGGGPTLGMITTRMKGTGAQTIDLQQTPAVGNSIILGMNHFGATCTGVASTNVTWTRVLGPSTDAGGGVHEIWVGVVGASPGNTITATFTGWGGFNVMSAIEITWPLTPTVGVSLNANGGSATRTLTGVTPGHLVIGWASDANTGNNTFITSITPPGVGRFIGDRETTTVEYGALVCAVATGTSVAMVQSGGTRHMMVEVS